MKDTYEPVIGLEIHIELETNSKMFCGCKNDPFHAPKPNMYTCPVCLGLPGTLPVPNRKAVEWTILIGLALNCTINEESKFDRKHYFYPDLPKGYQISQYDQPLCSGGSVETSKGKVRVNRVHLEEDTGKLQHKRVGGKDMSLVDFNRSGVPLVEIVTEPDFVDAAHAKEFLRKLQQIVRYLGVARAEMSEGTMRIEPNISLKVKGAAKLPDYKVEVKNINSFKFAEKAIEYELKRHEKLLKTGKTPKQETRGYVEATESTVGQRSKEEAHDYRYFPEPDIPPMRFTKTAVKKLKQSLPELPDEKVDRFQKQLGLSEYNARQLVTSQKRADYFDTAVAIKGSDAKAIANWIINKKVDVEKTSPNKLVAQIKKTQEKPTVSKDALQEAVQAVLDKNTKAVVDYKSGKENVIGFLLGQVMRELGGSADPKYVRQALKTHLT